MFALQLPISHATEIALADTQIFALLVKKLTNAFLSTTMTSICCHQQSHSCEWDPAQRLDAVAFRLRKTESEIDINVLASKVFPFC